MSLCDTCIDPGHCCKRIGLFRGAMVPARFFVDEPIEPQIAAGMQPNDPVPPWRLLEYKNVQFDPATGRPTAEAALTCSLLTPAGRCGDYEKRPNLCRQYEPGSDQLCVHYSPPPTGAGAPK